MPQLEVDSGCTHVSLSGVCRCILCRETTRKVKHRSASRYAENETLFKRSHLQPSSMRCGAHGYSGCGSEDVRSSNTVHGCMAIRNGINVTDVLRRQRQHYVGGSAPLVSAPATTA